jgi:hypothetical protein
MSRRDSVQTEFERCEICRPITSGLPPVEGGGATGAAQKKGGHSEEQIARLHGPIGLDLGGRQPEATALAILAEMTVVRFGGSARRT